MKKTLLILTTLIGSMTFAQDCSDLFISEYLEGYENSKALEIYNPTSSAIDLSAYSITRYSGGTTSPAANYTVQLVGMIAPYSTHVGVVDKRDPNGTGNELPVWPELAAKADAWYSPVYATSPCWYWNGDDGIALTKNGTSTLVDFFGKLGEDPGTSWTSESPFIEPNGAWVTKDHFMIRKPTILQGDKLPSDTFDPLLEYDSLPAPEMFTGTLVGDFETLGTHTCDCAPLGLDETAGNIISIYPNPSNGNFEVKGVNEFTSIVVLNALGQTVTSIKNNTKSVVKFNMSERKGVYFVKLSASNGNVITRKVIIK
tara:strand:+ start:57281 stop:58222 length:942 start_codon:yes stop_codon:yes gene_type:complete